MWVFLKILFLISTAHAQLVGSEFKPSPYLGINVGVTDSDGPTTPKEVSLSYGGRLGFVFYDHVALGAYTNYYTSSQATENIAYAPLLAELLFFPHHTPYDLNTYYVGAAFGTTHMIIKDAAGKHTDNATTFALTVGYSVLLWENITLGPEVQYFFIYSDADNFHLTTAHFTLKYHF